MGRINYIVNPKYWKVDFEGVNNKLEDDIVYKMIIGDGDDEGSYDIVEFISKNNYEKIIEKVYTIKIFPYAEIPILLFDEEMNLISLVNGHEILYERLNRYQVEYLEKNCPNFEVGHTGKSKIRTKN